MLHAAAEEAHKEDIIDFTKAMSYLHSCDLEFFQVPPQFHLDERHYLASQKQPQAVNVVQQSLEHIAFQFRMRKGQNQNKSFVNQSEEGPSSVATEKRAIEIRLSERGARPVLVDFAQDQTPIVPLLQLPNFNQPDSEENKSSRRTLEGGIGRPH